MYLCTGQKKAPRYVPVPNANGARARYKANVHKKIEKSIGLVHVNDSRREPLNFILHSYQ